jgi:hypothetical protein
MERFKILKIQEHKEYISVYINDSKEDISFWLDCSLMDGFGNKDNFKTEDLYIDWEFNQYIFNTDNSIDIKAKEYQENGDNIDEIQYFLDEKNDELVAKLRG